MVKYWVTCLQTCNAFSIFRHAISNSLGLDLGSDLLIWWSSRASDWMSLAPETLELDGGFKCFSSRKGDNYIILIIHTTYPHSSVVTLNLFLHLICNCIRRCFNQFQLWNHPQKMIQKQKTSTVPNAFWASLAWLGPGELLSLAVFLCAVHELPVSVMHLVVPTATLVKMTAFVFLSTFDL